MHNDYRIVENIKEEMTVYGTNGLTGALVIAVTGTAEKHGLKVGDVIIEYDNREISNTDDIPSDANFEKGEIVILRKQCHEVI